MSEFAVYALRRVAAPQTCGLCTAPTPHPWILFQGDHARTALCDLCAVALERALLTRHALLPREGDPADADETDHADA